MLLLIALLAATTAAAPRPARAAKPSPPVGSPLESVKLQAGDQKARWVLAIEYKKGGSHRADELNAYLEGDIPAPRAALLAPYKDRLGRMATMLGFLGETQTHFLYGPVAGNADPAGNDLPFDVLAHKGSTYLVAHVAVDTVYNTLRLSPKQRAAKVATGIALPALRAMHKALGANPDGVAVFVTYGSRDFSDESSTQGECVGILAARSDVKSFVDGDLSDVALAAKSQVLISDRSAMFDFVKVELPLE